MRDEIGLCQSMEVELELKHESPFFIRQFPIKGCCSLHKTESYTYPMHGYNNLESLNQKFLNLLTSYNNSTHEASVHDIGMSSNHQT